MNDTIGPFCHNYFESDMKRPEIIPVALGTACVISVRSPAKTTPNEDSACVIPFSDEAAVLIVADGMGGSAAGEQASRLAVEAMRMSIEEIRGTDFVLRTGILNGFELANNVVQQMGVGAGTTLAVVEIDGSMARPYHVGDSMILITGNLGKVKFQSVAHSPVGYAVESGLIGEDEAMHHEDRHVISNFVGSAEMRIEIGARVELAPRDTVLLASDGLFDNLSCDEIVELVRKGKLSASMLRLNKQARARMVATAEGGPSKPDDLSCVTFRLKRPSNEVAALPPENTATHSTTG